MSVRSLTTRPAAVGLALLLLVGATAAWKTTGKTVSLSVDGKTTRVNTHGGTVRDVLAAANLKAGAHDLVAPAADTAIKDDSRVVLRRGREMTLVVDGVSRSIWVTATSVDEALSQVGVRAAGAVLSADRSRAIPLKGFSLVVRTPKSVKVVDGGKVLSLTSTELRLGDALKNLHVGLRPADRIDVPVTTALRNGLVAHITRVDSRKVGADVALPFANARRPDAGMYRGTTKVLRVGRAGSSHRVYAVTYVNHKVSTRRLVSSRLVVNPVSGIVAYGTKVRAQAAATVSSSGGLNWGALAKCESGGDPRAVSSSGQYRGLYQFSMSTWSAQGGSGDPIDASSSEQTKRAQILYNKSGSGQWPVCGKYL